MCGSVNVSVRHSCTCSAQLIPHTVSGLKRGKYGTFGPQHDLCNTQHVKVKPRLLATTHTKVHKNICTNWYTQHTGACLVINNADEGRLLIKRKKMYYRLVCFYFIIEKKKERNIIPHIKKCRSVVDWHKKNNNKCMNKLFKIRQFTCIRK